MSLSMFVLFLNFTIIWGALLLFLLWKSVGIMAPKLLAQDDIAGQRLLWVLMSASVSLRFIGLFKFLSDFDLSEVSGMDQENCPFFSWFTFVEYRFLKLLLLVLVVYAVCLCFPSFGFSVVRLLICGIFLDVVKELGCSFTWRIF